MKVAVDLKKDGNKIQRGHIFVVITVNSKKQNIIVEPIDALHLQICDLQQTTLLNSKSVLNRRHRILKY